MQANQLPTPSQVIDSAWRRLGDAYANLDHAADWLRSDWTPGAELTDQQAAERKAMWDAIGKAKAAIDRARRVAR